MAHKGFYLWDDEVVPTLWIIPPKCGSHSFSEHFPQLRAYRGTKQGDVPVRIEMVVRHPYERVVSGLREIGQPYTTEAVLANIGNMHLSPYQVWMGGRDNVNISLLEDMPRHFPGYPHLNSKSHPPWRATAIDWGRVYPIYQRDFELCPHWSH